MVDPAMKIVAGPVAPIEDYAETLSLDDVCSEPTCSTSVLIDEPSDLFFVSILSPEDDGTSVAALSLVWRCPVCATLNEVEAWTLAAARAPGWPPPLSSLEADQSPKSVLIPVSVRHAALSVYLAAP